MQIQNVVNVRYNQTLPDGSTTYVLAKSNVVNTNIFKKPTVVVVNRPINQNPYTFGYPNGNNYVFDFLFLLALNRFIFPFDFK